MFVLGFERDVFVSYAHVDDEPLRPGQQGWVTSLKKNLEHEVQQRLGARSFAVWMDHELAGNKPISQELIEKVGRSATLLVVMSPSYVASEWCRRERNAFLQLAHDCVKQGRIFIVRLREPEPPDIPREFGDLIGYRFWTEDPDTHIARPLGALEQLENEYYDQLLRLADKLASTLKELKSAPGSRRVRAQPPSDTAVFVAPSTDDLSDREEELKGYLEQQGLAVLPRTWFPQNDAQAFQAAMEADLRVSKVFAQILSANTGRKVAPGVDRRYPVLHWEIASAAGLARSILQWRSPGLDLRGVEDPRHRALLDSARACSFEEFKRAVVSEARRTPPREREVRTSIVAFVDADAQDLRIAEEVQEYLGTEGIGSFLPALTGPVEEVRRDFEQNLKECDGLLLVYGSSEPLWVRNQMLQIRKIASQRDRPLAVLGLFMGPPPQKSELGFKMPNVITLDCRAGIRPEALREFALALRQQERVAS